jgi:HEAT repeat protein
MGDIPVDLQWALVKALLISNADQQINSWEAPSHQPVLVLLRQGDPCIQGFAAYALGEVKCSQAVDDLIDMLKSPNMHLRHIAARALGKIGDAKAVMPLIEVLCCQKEAVVVQTAASLALGRLGDPRAQRILSHLALTEQGCLKEKAVAALTLLNKTTDQRVARK